VRVGADLSVVGFDDIMLADLATPPLTTVRQPLPAMADAAFAHLQAGVERTGAAANGTSLLLRPELVVRESTGPAPDPSADALRLRRRTLSRPTHPVDG
jgi:DNA-binding LacI/PurR family transcriptional regulator